jgi:hypothetical protein
MKRVLLKVKPEGRPCIWIPEKESLKEFIKSRKLKEIHNFVGVGPMVIGAGHPVKSVLRDIDRAGRLAVFTDPKQNMGHSLALILNNELQMYDIGQIEVKDLRNWNHYKP